MIGKATHTLKAASLIEAVVALIIISVILLIGIKMYGQFYRGAQTVPLTLEKKLEAWALPDPDMLQMGESTLLLEDGTPVIQTVTPYTADTALIKIERMALARDSSKMPVTIRFIQRR